MTGIWSELDYSYKTDFENWRENQDFGGQNISMSRPPLDSSPIGTNTTNGKLSPNDSIPIKTKILEPTSQTRPTDSSTQPEDLSTWATDSSKRKWKAHLPAEPESDPSPSDSSSSESDSSDNRNGRKYKRNNEYDSENDINYSKSNRNKHDKRKKRRKHKKQDLPDSSSSDYDSSNNSDYRRKRRNKKKIHRKKDPIKICARLTAKLLILAYKSKIIKFKLYEDPLMRWIYFLTFVESLEMIFYQYEETCEVLLEYTKLGREILKILYKRP